MWLSFSNDKADILCSNLISEEGNKSELKVENPKGIATLQWAPGQQMCPGLYDKILTDTDVSRNYIFSTSDGSAVLNQSVTWYSSWVMKRRWGSLVVFYAY